jgi:hypothetical protein
VIIWGLNNHNRVCIDCFEDFAQRFRLLRTRDIAPTRPSFVAQQCPCVIEQAIKPFNVVARDAH